MVNKTKVREEFDTFLNAKSAEFEAALLRAFGTPGVPESWGTSEIAERNQKSLMSMLGGAAPARKRKR